MMLKHDYFQFWGTKLAVSTVSLTCLLTYPVSAQVIPDNSLGSENSIVTPNVTVQDRLADLIEGGAIRGNNLFHSFSEFNVNDGGNVYFANPDGIANILTRVTGNNISEIFGTLGIDGTANLFLLNPNGIVFGENAALDVSGSFLGTTADSYVFENGFEYSASNPGTPPLLTINLPLGMQFGTKAKAIVNQSYNSNEFEELVGLEVAPSQNLTFLGGDIVFEGGLITALNGFIEIGSVTPNGSVKIIPTESNWTLDYTEIDSFQDVNLTKAANINSSGDGAGQINIHANNLNVLESSVIAADNYGTRDSGSLTIDTQESVIVDGQNADGIASSIHADIYSTGTGADLTIDTAKLEVTNSGFIAADNFGIGDGGNLTINATDSISLIGVEDGNDSFISTNVFNSGNAGNLTIETKNLTIKEPAFISSDILIYGDVSDLGDGGDVTIKALGLVEVDGSLSLLSTSTYLQTDIPLAELNLTPNSGNGGNLSIEADTLLVTNSAKIAAASHGTSDGGNLEINVRQLTIQDVTPQIGTVTWGSGNAGDLIIRASESIDISGTGLGSDLDLAGELDIFSSGLFASVEPGATGNGGNLIIETGNLSLSDGAKIVANTLGEGDGGNISIRANNIEVKDMVVDISDTRSGINSTVEPRGIGNGGNLEIITDNLSLIDGGSIAADSLGEGNAGNIDIQAQNLNISGVSAAESVLGIEQSSLPSSISAFSQGDFAAGSITIDSNNLNLSNQGKISVSNLGNGNSGNLNITANELNLDRFAIIEAQVNAGNRGNINLTTDNINLDNQSQITVRATGTATGGNLTIDNSNLILARNNSDIKANAVFGSGGNINISSKLIFTDLTSDIDASSKFGMDGVVEIQSPESEKELGEVILPTEIEDPTSLIVASCPSSGDNTFAVTGNGGIPNSPYQTQSLNTTWYDLRPVKPEKTQTASLPTPLTEASITMIDTNGELELVALTSLSTHRWIRSSCQN